MLQARIKPSCTLHRTTQVGNEDLATLSLVVIIIIIITRTQMFKFSP